MEIGKLGQQAKVIRVPGKPLKRIPVKLPWPRVSKEEKDLSGKVMPSVPLGIDVVAKKLDITKIVHKFFRVDGVPMEELLQEVFVAIIHKNCTRSAHNPNKSSFGHYVYMVANNVSINLVHKKRRYDREKDSIDAPVSADDARSILDTVEDPNARQEPDAFSEKLEEFEHALRMKGEWDLARYIRAVRSGASADVVRESLSFGERKVTTKTIRDFKQRIPAAVRLIAATMS
jgi:hypothetical protein